MTRSRATRGAGLPPGMRMSEDRLRRVFAAGWLAGARSHVDPADADAVGSLNPCTTPADRRKWHEAFTAAAARRGMPRTER